MEKERTGGLEKQCNKARTALKTKRAPHLFRVCDGLHIEHFNAARVHAVERHRLRKVKRVRCRVRANACMKTQRYYHHRLRNALTLETHKEIQTERIQWKENNRKSHVQVKKN